MHENSGRSFYSDLRYALDWCVHVWWKKVRPYLGLLFIPLLVALAVSVPLLFSSGNRSLFSERVVFMTGWNRRVFDVALDDPRLQNLFRQKGESFDAVRFEIVQLTQAKKGKAALYQVVCFGSEADAVRNAMSLYLDFFNSSYISVIAKVFPDVEEPDDAGFVQLSRESVAAPILGRQTVLGLVLTLLLGVFMIDLIILLFVDFLHGFRKSL